MIITYVNRLCQKHSRTAFLIIGVLIIIPFVFLWGSPRDFLRDGGRNGSVGRMYGKTLAQDTFVTAMRRTEVAIFLRYGQLIGQDSRTQPMWIQETLRRLRAMHEARQRGLDTVAPEEIAKTIRGLAMFQKDGAFDPTAFMAFERNVLRSRGFDGRGFDGIVAETIAIERLEREVRAGVFVSPIEARQDFDRLDETFSTALHFFRAAEFLPATGAVTDAAVREFYAKNVECYRTDLAQGKTPADLAGDPRVGTYLMPYYVPEQKQMRVAVFPFAKHAAAAAAAVTDARIKASYEERKAEFQREEVQARHILIQVPQGADDAAKAAKRKVAEGLLKQLQGGADFAKLAGQHSDDPGSKGQGGDLGWFGRGEMVPVFEDAVFSLKKGQISGVIETQFGFHLVQLQDRRAGRALAAVQPEIRAQLIQAETLALAQQAAAAFGDVVSNAVADAPDNGPAPAALFAKTAAAQRVEMHDTAWFRAGGDPLPFAGEADLGRNAFKLSAALPVGSVIVGRDACYVPCWLATKKPYLPALASEPGLVEQVKAQLMRDRAVELARKTAQTRYGEIQKKLAGGTAWAVAAAGLAFTDEPAFSRVKPPTGLPEARAILEAIGDRAAPALVAPVNTPDGALLVYLKQRTAPAEKDFADQRDQVIERLRKQKDMMALQDFYRRLEADSNTTLNEGWRPR